MKKNIIISVLALGLGVGAYCHAEDSATTSIDAVAVWTKNCKKCHGTDGVPSKIGKKFGARDYTDAAVQATFTDDEIIAVTKEGVVDGGKKKMPAYSEKLSDAEIEAMVPLIRAFAK